ncbi:helix-turn-helix domain-containing protein [Enterococcus italicus]|uniref:helix-turn-helix domain-containing protein n=1 Tax=Enterococcus italicus TaxID=246144 RepID=UPI0020747E1E|nr:helix-turn-helix domain-containing protein [Enterococcus italicus]
MFQHRIKELRLEKRYTQQEVADKLGITRPAYTAYEAGKRQPDFEILKALSSLFEVTTDYLLGKSDKRNYYDLTEKDERDIASELEDMINDLSGNVLFSKNSAEVNDETRELLIASLENSLRIAKLDAKKRFTPKKYRD